jgi:tetratricopeptide (TPR) repeat protein
LLPRALKALVCLQKEKAGEDLAAALVPRLAQRDGYARALQAALAIAPDYPKGKALLKLALHLAQIGQGSRALEVIGRLPKEHGWGTELAQIAAALAKAGRHDQALAVMEKIKYSGDQGKALASVAAYLPEPRLVNSLACAASAMFADDWLKTAIGIINRLPKGPKETVYQSLAHLLAEKIESSTGSHEWVAAFSEESFPVLKDPALKALAGIRGMTDHGDRAKALAALAPALPHAGRQAVCLEALTACRKSASADTFQSIAATLSPHLQILDHPSLLAGWQGSLSAMAERGRADVLAGLAASARWIAHLGGEETVLQTAAAIRKVAQWWP